MGIVIERQDNIYKVNASNVPNIDEILSRQFVGNVQVSQNVQYIHELHGSIIQHARMVYIVLCPPACKQVIVHVSFMSIWNVQLVIFFIHAGKKINSMCVIIM